MENVSVQIPFKCIQCSPRLKPRRRDAEERPTGHIVGDRRHEGAGGHRRVDAESIEQLPDQDSAERASEEVRQHRKCSSYQVPLAIVHATRVFRQTSVSSVDKVATGPRLPNLHVFRAIPLISGRPL